jgi:c-di-GMP-binding flagellar brake protein YcgR
MQERRRYVRWPICQSVKYKIKDNDKESQCSCRDLGPKGIGLELDKMLSTGTLLDLEIWLGQQGRIVASGQIVWLKQLESNSERYIAGLSFIKINDIAKERIFQYMVSNYPEKLTQRWWQGLSEVNNK